MHAIRLRGPWEKRHATDGGWRRVRVPEQRGETEVTADEGIAARVTYRRHFNLPSGLGPNTRVLLEIAPQAGELIEVRINRRKLSSEFRLNAESESTRPTQYDISGKLSAHNRIEIDLCSEVPAHPRLSGDIRLLIVES